MAQQNEFSVCSLPISLTPVHAAQQYCFLLLLVGNQDRKAELKTVREKQTGGLDEAQQEFLSLLLLGLHFVTLTLGQHISLFSRRNHSSNLC